MIKSKLLICTRCGKKFLENKGKWKQRQGFPSLFFFWYCTKCFNQELREIIKRDKPRIEFLKARASKEGLTVNEYAKKHKNELKMIREAK